MRKLSLAMMGIATAALMTMVSCRKPVNGVVTPGEARTVTFTATTESNDGSKTAVVGKDIQWKSGDKISVNGEEMTLASGAGSTEGTFTGTITTAEEYYIGYPAATTTYTSPNTLKLCIPSSWTYDANNVVVPMAAYTKEEGNISFSNAVNVLKLNLNGNGNNASKLTSIVLSHASAKLNGDIAVTFDEKGDPTFGYANGTTTTTVNFSGGLQLTEETTSIYIVLPKIGASKVSNNITVTFNCANGRCIEKTITYKSEFDYVNQLISNGVNTLTVDATDATTLSGEFTVNLPSKGEPKKIKFSRGNLQYIGSAATPYWKFADNQWVCLGNSGQGSTSTTADRDLFGWGTSGWDNDNEYYMPYDTKGNEDELEESGWGYGPTDGSSYEFNLTGKYAQSDWGVHNAISNDAAGMWRTFTNDEWAYLLKTRKVTVGGDQKASYGHGKVNDVNGLIILPDNWDGSVCPSFTYGNSGWSNTFTIQDWSAMESAGAVFLPAAGDRSEESVASVGLFGQYWSSSYYDGSSAKNLSFKVNDVTPEYTSDRYNGFSVRLVKVVSSSK